jgi:hypothetical protein
VTLCGFSSKSLILQAEGGVVLHVIGVDQNTVDGLFFVLTGFSGFNVFISLILWLSEGTIVAEEGDSAGLTYTPHTHGLSTRRCQRSLIPSDCLFLYCLDIQKW